jgi:hypothetical protein
MKVKSIKDLDITEEMYRRALEVESAWQLASKFDARSLEFKKLNNEWIKLDDAFQDEVNDEYSTREIIIEYERRMVENKITKETRRESNETVNKKIRYSQIVECLIHTSRLTAKECAVKMMQKGYIPTSERNFTAPRLTELESKGVVEVVGKTKCNYTHKMVSVYRINPNIEISDIYKLL